VAIPGKAFDAHLRDVAAEAAVSVEQNGAGACARGGERCREARRSAAHHQHIGLRHDLERARGFVDLFHAGILTGAGVRAR